MQTPLTNVNAPLQKALVKVRELRSKNFRSATPALIILGLWDPFGSTHSLLGGAAQLILNSCVAGSVLVSSLYRSGSLGVLLGILQHANIDRTLGSSTCTLLDSGYEYPFLLSHLLVAHPPKPTQGSR
jgi:hypothetical protein